jgi:hypothetical protein
MVMEMATRSSYYSLGLVLSWVDIIVLFCTCMDSGDGNGDTVNELQFRTGFVMG